MTKDSMKLDEINRKLVPVPRPPRMSTFNTIGSTIVYEFKEPDLGSNFYGIYGFSFGFYPVTIKAIYLVSHPVVDGTTQISSYLFHGEVPKALFEKMYPGRLLRIRLVRLLGLAAIFAAGFGVWYYRTTK